MRLEIDIVDSKDARKPVRTGFADVAVCLLSGVAFFAVVAFLLDSVGGSSARSPCRR